MPDDAGRGQEKFQEKCEMGAAIELLNLCQSYGSVSVIRDVSFSVEPGELVTILGPSGSGKTTILSAIAGFAEPSSGEILIDGESVRGLPPESRNLGVMFQQYALFPHMRVSENIAYPLLMRAVPRQVIEDKLKQISKSVGLGDYLNHYPAQLSGGQQQRVALARAMVFDPSALLLDEPLSALDKKLRERMQFELKELHGRTDMTMLYVTHDQDEALLISDRIAIMSAGRLEQIGTPEQIYLKPANRFVAEFIGESNFLDATVQAGPDLRRLRIDNDLGVPLQRDSALCVGDRATLMIRPERIIVGSQASGLPISFPGRIEDRFFIGSTLKLKISIGAGETITACLSNSQFSQDTCRASDHIQVGWHADDMTMFQL
jgi:ABC-type Fe3+/spermidine/putrescine transport system ATPase subunit